MGPDIAASLRISHLNFDSRMDTDVSVCLWPVIIWIARLIYCLEAAASEGFRLCPIHS